MIGLTGLVVDKATTLRTPVRSAASRHSPHREYSQHAPNGLYSATGTILSRPQCTTISMCAGKFKPRLVADIADEKAHPVNGLKTRPERLPIASCFCSSRENTTSRRAGRH